MHTQGIMHQISLRHIHLLKLLCGGLRTISTTTTCYAVQAGKYKPSVKGDKPLTYEMANPPPQIAHRKAWNSWNTANLINGLRAPQIAIDEMFIRKFVTGTWHGLVLSEIIIKRQHNIIRIAALIYQGISPRKMYFLIGYTEEMLSYWLQCPVKLELQTVGDRNQVIFKYI